MYGDEPECPYCGKYQRQFENSDLDSDGYAEYECENCEKYFTVYGEMTITFSCSKMEG